MTNVHALKTIKLTPKHMPTYLYLVYIVIRVVTLISHSPIYKAVKFEVLYMPTLSNSSILNSDYVILIRRINITF